MTRLLDDLDADAAVRKLIAPWSDVLSPRETGLDGYLPIDYDPMLVMLQVACGSSYGAGASGASSDPASRSLLNLEAISLREHIDGTVRAWVRELSRQEPEANLADAVKQLAGILNAHHAAGTIPDSEYARICRFFPRWCDRIWQLYDPPVVKELVGPCPNPDCEQTRYRDGDGSVTTALIAYYRRGGEMAAKCRACSWEWTGPGLVVLGRHLGATQDEEVIKAAGLG